MKKVYVLLGVLAAMAIEANGQTTLNLEGTATKFSRSFTKTHVKNRPGIISGDREADAIIWSNEFEDATEWTIAGPVGEPIGWSIGNTTNGWYFGTGDDMGTTGDFARFVNGDPTGDDIETWGEVHEGGPFTLTYNDSVDLTDIPAPHLEFDQYGACFQTNQLILISTDDWATVDTVFNQKNYNEVLTDISGSVFDQPQHIRVNLTPYIAGDPSNVRIQLYWDGGINGGDPSFVEYAWYVDNIKIVEGHTYDSDAQAGYFKSGVGEAFESGLQYYEVPLSQRTAIQMSAETINQGGATFTGLALTTTVNKGAETVFTCTSDPADVAPSELDSMGCTTAFTPDYDVATYDITWSFAGTEPDTYTANDEVTDSFDVTEFTYSRDNGVLTNTITNFATNTGQPFLIGNCMEYFEEDRACIIQVRLGNDASNVGQLIYGQIMKWDEGTNEFIYVDQTPDYEITAGDNGGDINLHLEDIVYFDPGDLILVMVGHYGGTDVSFGMAQEVTEGVFGYDAANTRFGLIDPNAIMISLLSPIECFGSVGEEESNPFTIGQNQPNPFGVNTVINYEINEASAVSVEFVDVSGKVVKTINNGTQEAGAYSIELDGNEFAEGVYFYTFTIGNQKVTKRMIVTN